MHINIEGRIKPTRNPTNAYRVVLKAMHGDADAYTKETLDIKEGNSFLHEFLEEMMDAKGSHVFDEPFARWTNYEFKCAKKNLSLDTKDEIYTDWPSDITNIDYPAMLEDYEVTYFDENGIEHKVHLSK